MHSHYYHTKFYLLCITKFIFSGLIIDLYGNDLSQSFTWIPGKVVSSFHPLFSCDNYKWNFRLNFDLNEIQADRFSADLGMGKQLQGGLLELHKKDLSTLTVDPL